MSALLHMAIGRLLVRLFARPGRWIEAHDRPLQPKNQPTFKQRHL